MPSSASSSAPSTTTIPRPPNSFILFRQEYARLYADPKTLVSKSAGEAWRALSDEDKQYYTAVEKEKHAEKYPAYRFRPQKKEVKEGRRSGLGPAISTIRLFMKRHPDRPVYTPNGLC